MMPVADTKLQTERILRKTDIYLLPFLALLFLLNSLDRSNIGNAETAGFTRHAGLAEEDLNDAVSAFFVAFVALQPVGAALGKRVGARRWVSGVMTGWGFLTCCMATVKTRAGLLVLRTAIGALEAGFYPTTVFYLSLFYTRYEFAQRLGLFYGQYAVAGAFGGLVSYVIFSLFPTTTSPDNTSPPPSSSSFSSSSSGTLGGFYSYQVLFLLEGILTMLVAITAWFYLPDGPGLSWFLTAEERSIAETRVYHDRLSQNVDAALPSHAHLSEHSSRFPSPESSSLLTSSTSKTPPEPPLTKLDMYTALTSPLLPPLLTFNILSSLAPIGISIFLPLLLLSNHTPLNSNLLTIPPFLLGAAALYLTTRFSDARQQRLPYIIASLLATLIALLLPTSYLSICLLVAFTFIVSPLQVAWISDNIPQPGKRAVMLGVNGWGNLAGVLAGYVWRPEYGPSYDFSLKVTAGCMGVSAVGYALFWLGLVQENKRRAKIVARGTRREVGWRGWVWERFGGRWKWEGEERAEMRFGY